ncbi:MAG: hypothetical protein AB1473_12485 [Thermodesulfobacteriota bacterium]
MLCQGQIVTNELQRIRYTFNSSAARFLEADAESIVSLTPNLKANLWATGSILRNSGPGNISGDVTSSLAFRSQPNSFTSEDTQFSQSWFAFGLSFEASF